MPCRRFDTLPLYVAADVSACRRQDCRCRAYAVRHFRRFSLRFDADTPLLDYADAATDVYAPRAAPLTMAHITRLARARASHNIRYMTRERASYDNYARCYFFLRHMRDYFAYAFTRCRRAVCCTSRRALAPVR